MTAHVLPLSTLRLIAPPSPTATISVLWTISTSRRSADSGSRSTRLHSCCAGRTVGRMIAKRSARIAVGTVRIGGYRIGGVEVVENAGRNVLRNLGTLNSSCPVTHHDLAV